MIKNIKKPTIFKFLGPGLLVTVGFIDPGNWATNLAAGSYFGYKLLWIVSVSTIILIILQHNAAKLGVATGKCMAEATAEYLPPWARKFTLGSAFIASVSTALAEILGSAIAMDILFGVPLKLGVILTSVLVIPMIIFNTHRTVSNVVIGFVAVIAFLFIYETTLFTIDWDSVFYSATVPNIPLGSIAIIVGVLGAVVMPHNLFLHSEIIQNRRWHLSSVNLKKKLLKFQFIDTIFSMLLGWAINCTIIILAAEVFFKNGVIVEDLSQASYLLEPVLGASSSIAFATALLCAGIAASITASISGGTVVAGLFKKEYHQSEKYSRIGIVSTLLVAAFVTMFINNPLQALIYSQILLSIQLPITIFLQLYITSNKNIMKELVNNKYLNILLFGCAAFVTVLNIILLVDVFTQ